MLCQTNGFHRLGFSVSVADWFAQHCPAVEAPVLAPSRGCAAGRGPLVRPGGRVLAAPVAIGCHGQVPDVDRCRPGCEGARGGACGGLAGPCRLAASVLSVVSTCLPQTTSHAFLGGIIYIRVSVADRVSSHAYSCLATSYASTRMRRRKRRWSFA